MIKPDGSLDCVLYLQSRREGGSDPSPERERAVSYLNGLTDWTEPASAQELVAVQQYFFPHASRRFLQYVASDLMVSVEQAREAIHAGLAGD